MSAEPPAPAAGRPRPLMPGTVRAGRLGRFLAAADYAAAALLAVAIFGILLVRHPPAVGLLGNLPLDWFPRVVLAAALAAVICVPVVFRRRRPGFALAVLLTGCGVLLALGGALSAGPVVPLALVLYMAAAAAARPAAVYGLAASLALLAIQGVQQSLAGIGSGNEIVAALFLIVAWTVGYAIRQRRAYTARLREQAARQIAAAAVTEERLRIARELHDVVAHSMTVAAVQAGFGEYVFDSQPAKARAALAAIQTVTRDALADMQRLLGVLRQAGEPQASAAAAAVPGRAIGPGGPSRGAAAPLRPAPGLADLDRLVAATAGAGVEVTVHRTGPVRQIPAGTDLSAFRIVQEALTNVVKHSGAGACRVSIGYGTAELSVEVTDPGPGHRPRAGGGSPAAAVPDAAPVRAASAALPAGHGLMGMRERVSLCGGAFSAAPLPGAGFRVWARLPLADGPR